MRRLIYVTLLVSLSFAPRVRAEEEGTGSAPAEGPTRVFEPIDSKELKAIDKAFDDYVAQSWPPAERLEEVERLIAGLDAARAEGGKKSLLADVDSLARWLGAEYPRDRIKGPRLQLVEWKRSEHKIGIIAGDATFQLNVGSRVRPDEPAPTILLLADSSVEVKKLKDLVRDVVKSKALKEGFLIVTPHVSVADAIKLPNVENPVEQAERERKYADDQRAVELERFVRTLAPLIWLTRNAFIDTDRVYIVGLGDRAAQAMQMAASFTDNFAGVLFEGDVPEHPLAENLGLTHRGTIAGANASELGEKIAAALAGDAPPKRDLFRKAISWRFTDLDQQKAFWLYIEVDRPDPEIPIGRIEAKIDGNTIMLETERVEALRILLNDRLVDLDRPVTIVVNGEPRKVELKRSFQHLIEWGHRLAGDPRYTFTASVVVKVPPKPTEVPKEEEADAKDAKEEEAPAPTENGKEGDEKDEKKEEEGEKEVEPVKEEKKEEEEKEEK